MTHHTISITVAAALARSAIRTNRAATPPIVRVWIIDQIRTNAIVFAEKNATAAAPRVSRSQTLVAKLRAQSARSNLYTKSAHQNPVSKYRLT